MHERSERIHAPIQPARPPADLVTTDWLAARLGEPEIGIVDGSFYLPALKRNAKAEFLAGHIPGAVFFDIDAIADHSNRPAAHAAGRRRSSHEDVGALGIGDDDTIVVYDGAGLVSARRGCGGRSAFSAREKVYILDGGLPKWKAEGRPVEKRRGQAHAAKVRGRARHRRGRHASPTCRWRCQRQRAQVVDARPADRFRGEAPEPRAGRALRPHAGRQNVPVTELVEDGRLISPEKIAQAFAAGGVDLDKPITTCGSGVTAVILSSASRDRQAARDCLRGSWTEWGGRRTCRSSAIEARRGMSTRSP